MQFIFHPITVPGPCKVNKGLFDQCTGKARYQVDETQEDLVHTILEVGSVDGEYVLSNPIEICLNHAAKVIKHDHSSFRVVPMTKV